MVVVHVNPEYVLGVTVLHFFSCRWVSARDKGRVSEAGVHSVAFVALRGSSVSYMPSC